MGGLLWAGDAVCAGASVGVHGLAQAAVLLVLIAGGIAVYGLLLSLLGVTGWREALDAIRQTAAGATCARKARVANDGAETAGN